MGMKAPLPRDRAALAGPAGRRGAAVGAAMAGMLAGLLPGLLPLGGCAHRDAVDTTLDWWHQYQGGVIAQQRPPPPGAHEPYPAVGLTPTTPPVLPSAERRQDVTEALIEQRNLAHRMAAEVGPLTNTAVPVAPARPAAPAAADAASSATLEAAEAPPAPVVAPKPAGKASSAPADGSAGPLVAMPEVGEDVGGVGGKAQAVAGPLPEIPAGPPMAPQFPGFAVPSDAAVAVSRPDYTLSDPGGTRILFPVGNDHPVAGQQKEIDSVARHAPDGPLFVHGYGEAASTDSAEQARAMALGLLRARVVAERLVADGVPAKAIHLRAHPFGDGVRIRTAE
ncbi:hypothetical protein ACMAUO_07140 [Gluconacetobacter sp. Hr-1-5]|uniref:hypothetical protein n=1 Tax=Gluconacetobacter sp. Hr-1-5 TaxID=3395370 RepID=UPI003B52D0BB